jgi:serine/threonine protein kinase
MSLAQALQDKYSFEPQAIGSGSQAEVYKGVNIATGQPVAIKKIDISEISHENLEREIANLNQVSSPYIVKCVEVIYTPELEEGVAVIVMEYIAGGSLYDYLHENKSIGDYQAYMWLQQLVMGMNKVWDQNIIHRDLKPANILLTEFDSDAQIRICDFGISKNTSKDAGITDLGTPLYKAPEVSKNVEYDYKVDIYSLGLIYLDMLVGLSESGDQEIPLRLCKLRTLEIESFAKRLIPRMLEYNPTQRINRLQLVNLFRYCYHYGFVPIHSNEICDVYRAWDLIDSCDVVLKLFSPAFPQSRTLEASILSEKDEPGIISFKESFDNCIEQRQVLVLEYLPGGTLQDFISQNEPVNERIARRWLRSLLQTVDSLHRKQVILRNLSPANIMLDKRSLEAELKLCDFELAANIDQWGVELENCTQNMAYWAPELLNKQQFTTASDVWSLGCVFIFILCGKSPFAQAKVSIETILAAQMEPPDLSQVSTICANLLQGMLKADEKVRFTIEDCIRHPFFALDCIEDLVNSQLLPRNSEIVRAALLHIQTDIDNDRLVPAFALIEQIKRLYDKFLLSDLSHSSTSRSGLTKIQEKITHLAVSLKPFAREKLQNSRLELVDDPLDIAIIWCEQMALFRETTEAQHFLGIMNEIWGEIKSVNDERIAELLIV